VALRGDVSAPFRAELEGTTMLTRFGEKLAAYGEKSWERIATIESANARSAMLQADVRARQDIPKNIDDYAMWEDDYRRRMGTAQETESGSIHSRNARAAFGRDVELMIERGAAAMNRDMEVRRGDVGRADLSNIRSGNLAAILSETDPVVRTELLDATNDAIEYARSEGFIDNEQAVSVRRKFAQDYAVGFVAGLEPEARLDMLELGMTITDDGQVTFEMGQGTVDVIPFMTRINLLESTRRELAQSQRPTAKAVMDILSVQLLLSIPDSDAPLEEYAAIYTDRMRAKMDSAVNLIDDPKAQDIFRAGAESLIERGIASLAGVVKARKADAVRADVNERISDSIDAALNTSEYEVQRDLLGGTEQIINDNIRAGVYSDEFGEDLIRRMYDGFSVAWVDSHELEERYAILTNGMSVTDGQRTFERTGTWVDEIPTDTRIKMVERAEGNVATLANNRITDASRELRNAASLLATGRLLAAEEAAALTATVEKANVPELTAQLAHYRYVSDIIHGLETDGDLAAVDALIKPLATSRTITTEDNFLLKAAIGLRGRMAAVQSAQHAHAKSALAIIESVYAAGENPTPEHLAAVTLLVDPFDDLMNSLAETKWIGESINTLRRLPLIDVEKSIDHIRDLGDLSPPQVRLLNAMESTRTTMERELDNDPTGWAVRSGVLKLDPFAPTDKKFVEARIRATAAAGAQFRIDMPFTTREETATLARGWDEGTALNQMSLLWSLTGMGLPWKQEERLLKDISEGNPLIGVLADTVRTNQVLVQEALDGFNFIKTTKMRFGQAKINPVLFAFLAGALEGDVGGHRMVALGAAAEAVLIERARAAGTKDGEILFDETAFTSVIEEFMGEKGTINGQQTFAPLGVPWEQFNSSRAVSAFTPGIRGAVEESQKRADRGWIQNLTDDDLHPRSRLPPAPGEFERGPFRILASGAQRVTADVLREAELVWVDDGKYLVRFEVGNRLEYVVFINEKGEIEEYVLNYHEITGARQLTPRIIAPAPAPAPALAPVSDVVDPDDLPPKNGDTNVNTAP
jgi:hypothetical protein